MHKVKLIRMVLTKDELNKLSPNQKKQFIMITSMIRDLNLLQKCLIFSGYPSEHSDRGPNESAKAILILFFLKTLISHIWEMWLFIKNSGVLNGNSILSDETRSKGHGVRSFLDEPKIRNVFSFIRNNFGFHYEYEDRVDASIDKASNELREFEMWLSKDSTNELFSSTNAVILEVICSEMTRVGFSGDKNALMSELFHMALKGADLLREFSVGYLAEGFKYKWEEQEGIEVDAPLLAEVKLPLIVASGK
jgi:uncharacterized protein YqcC (DUF446 family)